MSGGNDERDQTLNQILTEITESTTFWVMESIRLDLGYGSQVHP